MEMKMQSQFQYRYASPFPLHRIQEPVFYAVAPADSALSGRELQVLRLVADGLSNKEIASALQISAHTVARHVTNIMRKLEASNRAQAAAKALRSGLLKI
jgi:DNA-binding NarL/FixJ family response regulator